MLLHGVDKQFRWQQSTKLLIVNGLSVDLCVLFVLAFRRIWVPWKRTWKGKGKYTLVIREPHVKCVIMCHRINLSTLKKIKWKDPYLFYLIVSYYIFRALQGKGGSLERIGFQQYTAKILQSQSCQIEWASLSNRKVHLMYCFQDWCSYSGVYLLIHFVPSKLITFFLVCL